MIDRESGRLGQVEWLQNKQHGVASVVEFEADYEGRIFSERVQLIYRNAPIAQVMLLILVVLITAVLYEHRGAEQIDVWMLCMLAIGCTRLWQALRYRKDPVAMDRSGYWYWIAMAGTVAAGVGWAMLTLLVFRDVAPEYQNLIILILAWVAAGAVPVLSADLRLYLVYELLVLLPMLGILLWSDQTIYALFALAILLYILVLARSASYLNNMIVMNLRERLAKEAALEQSSQANRRLTDEIERRKKIERDLMAAKEVAEAANRVKGEFLANVSHEVRTPMNAIIGMTNLALETGMTAEQRDYLETVLSAANDLMGMMSEVLEFASLGGRDKALKKRPVLLAELVSSLLSRVSKSAQAKGLWLRQEIDPSVPEVVGLDPKPIEQVLDQLLENAIKFTERGGIDVRLGLSPERPGFLEFSVKDTGIGIAEDKLGLVFDYFTQADGSSTRRHGGLGIGLALAAGMAELVGGFIKVDSQLGVGSTFHFFFPYHIEANDA